MAHQIQIDSYIKENHGTVNNITKNVGRPPVAQSKDDEIKCRVEPSRAKEIMAFCSGRRISRSDYIRALLDLDHDYLDHIHLLNDPAVKELIFSALRLAKKI